MTVRSKTSGGGTHDTWHETAMQRSWKKQHPRSGPPQGTDEDYGGETHHVAAVVDGRCDVKVMLTDVQSQSLHLCVRRWMVTCESTCWMQRNVTWQKLRADDMGPRQGSVAKKVSCSSSPDVTCHDSHVLPNRRVFVCKVFTFTRCPWRTDVVQKC